MSENLSPASIEHSSGFASWASADMYTFQCRTGAEADRLVALALDNGRKLTPRGSGISYGDVALLPEHIAVKATEANRVLEWKDNMVYVEAGITIRQLCDFLYERGEWPAVTPGTSRPTIGGAISANIHGKNHLHQGTIADNVLAMDVWIPSRGVVTITPESEEFSWIVGGFGLFGIILRARLKTLSHPSGTINVTRKIGRNLEECVEIFNRDAQGYDAMAAWIDGYASGGSLGRGIVDCGRYQHLGTKPHPPASSGIVADHGWRALRMALRPTLMKRINQARFVTHSLIPGKTHNISLFEFNFQLDRLNRWERAYRPGALIQFQSTVPSEKAAATFRNKLTLAQSFGCPPNLVVLKKHRGAPGPLTYAMDGFSLAMDFHADSRNIETIRKLYSGLAEITIAAGGRFYLAKDELLTADQFRRSVPSEELELHRKMRDRLDPNRILSSSMAMRLGLV